MDDVQVDEDIEGLVKARDSLVKIELINTEETEALGLKMAACDGPDGLVSGGSPNLYCPRDENNVVCGRNEMTRPGTTVDACSGLVCSV